MPGVTKKVEGRRRHGKHPRKRPPCAHQRNEKDRVGECEKCGGAHAVLPEVRPVLL